MQGDDFEFIDIYSQDVSIFVRCEHLARYIYASEQLRKRRAKTAIDIACGSGYGAVEIAKYVDKVIAFDQFLPSNLNDEHVDFIKCDINSGDFMEKVPTDSRIDAVVCFETLEHVDNPKVFLQNISALLRRGGVLFLSVPNGKMEKKDESGLPVNEYHKHSFTEQELLELVTSNGFRIFRKLYQPTSAALYRNEARALRDLKKTSAYAKDMTASISDLHYFSRIFAWPTEDRGMSYSIMLMCEKE